MGIVVILFLAVLLGGCSYLSWEGYVEKEWKKMSVPLSGERVPVHRFIRGDKPFGSGKDDVKEEVVEDEDEDEYL